MSILYPEALTIWVVGNRLVLSLFEFGAEFVKRVAVGSIGNSDVVDLLESSDIERVCISVVDVCITTANARVSLVVVVCRG